MLLKSKNKVVLRQEVINGLLYPNTYHSILGSNGHLFSEIKAGQKLPTISKLSS